MKFPDLSPMFDALGRIPPGTLVTAAGVGLVAFLAGLAFARGVIKQLLGMFSLGMAVLVALFVYRHRSDVFGVAGANMGTDKLLMFAAGAGVLTFFVCRYIFHLLAGFGLLNFLGGLAGWKGMLVSAIPSGFLLWVGSMVLRLVGNLSGVESTAEIVQQGKSAQAQVTSWLHQLSQQVDRSALGSIAEKLDPFDLRATANLSRLLILWPDGTVWRRLAGSDPKVARMLNHPKLVALGRDPKVRQAIDRQDFAGLMQLPQVEEAAQDPELHDFLEGLALEEAMDKIIYRPK